MALGRCGLALLLLAALARGGLLTVFVEESEFQMACTDLELSQLDLTEKVVTRAQEPVGRALLDKAKLGQQLTLLHDAIQLPMDIVLRGTAEHGSLAFRRVVEDHGSPTDLVEIEGPKPTLSIRVSTALRAVSAEFTLVYAVGLTLRASDQTKSKSVRLLSPTGHEVRYLTELPTCKKECFLGFVSSVPIGEIIVDDHAPTPAAWGLQRVLLARAHAHLLEAVDPDMRWTFWTLFSVFIIAMLALDLFCISARSRTSQLSSALRWTLVWVLVAAAFAAGLYVQFGRGPAVIWVTAYLLEKFLSVDNLFVFLTIFASFRTPPRFQHKVLTWGIVSAIGLRAIFIFAGVALVERFSWLLALFGAFLLYAGVKALREELGPGGDDDEDKGDSGEGEKSHMLLRLLSRVFPLSPVDDSSGRFFIRTGDLPADTTPVCEPPRNRVVGILFRVGATIGTCLALPLWLLAKIPCIRGYSATPLFAALVVIEATDLMFAADSIPAVLSLTTDPFIAYTSNIFAILGLRALYFALAAAMMKFAYLSASLGVILVFIGLKLLGGLWGIHVSIEMTLIVVLSSLGIGIALSMLRPPPEPPALTEVTSNV
eukprot:m.253928 g.253928  ORF g.253928 m.253928 type:complete len:598 (+) comp18639_c0_seq1:3-1796(+)